MLSVARAWSWRPAAKRNELLAQALTSGQPWAAAFGVWVINDQQTAVALRKELLTALRTGMLHSGEAPGGPRVCMLLDQSGTPAAELAAALQEMLAVAPLDDVMPTLAGALKHADPGIRRVALRGMVQTLLESDLDPLERRLTKASGEAGSAHEEGWAALERVRLVLELRLIDADLIETLMGLMDIPNLREEALPLVRWHVDSWLRGPDEYKRLEHNHPAAPAVPAASGNPLLARVEVREVLKADPEAWPFNGNEWAGANLEIGLELLRDSNPEVRRSVCHKLKHWPQGERAMFRPALELLLQDPYAADVAGETLSFWDK
jgi:hypothetical protein